MYKEHRIPDGLPQELAELELGDSDQELALIARDVAEYIRSQAPAHPTKKHKNLFNRRRESLSEREATLGRGTK